VSCASQPLNFFITHDTFTILPYFAVIFSYLPMYPTLRI
jgi:hypothetical protein